MELIHRDSNDVKVYAYTEGGLKGHRYDIMLGHQLESHIDFQKGAVKEAGVNGVTNEALLAILIHRTNELNSKFPCAENIIAVEHMLEALANFTARTKNRIGRGVEGKEVA